MSLQGEGFHTGISSVFVRFSGCNLSCSFCDTKHESFVLMSDEEIVAEVGKYSSPWVVLTGGEPSLQVTERLVSLLHGLDKKVAIETNGTNLLPENIDWVTVSPKNVSMLKLSRADEVKIVYENGNDVEMFREKIFASHYFLQPCSCANTSEVVSYILSHPHWRLSLQTHKYIGIE